MKDIKKLKELILDKLDITEVMKKYNVDFVYNPDHVNEVQFHCPFHGKDNKPSARLYKDTKSAFCWVCRKTWDVIGFIMQKENLNYGGTIGYILREYKIDTSSIPDGPSIEPVKKHFVPEIKKIMYSIDNKINELKYKIPFEKYNTLCMVYDEIMYKISKGNDMISQAKKLEEKMHSIGIEK